MSYYENQMERYRKATPEVRAESKAHWLKCHKANLESGREDLICFSSRILADYALVDAELMKAANMPQARYVIKEVDPIEWDSDSYISDFLSLDYTAFPNTVFVLVDKAFCSDRWIWRVDRYSGINAEEFSDICDLASKLIDEMEFAEKETELADGSVTTPKMVLEEFKVPYSEEKCQKLMAWARESKYTDLYDIANLLTIITDKKWVVHRVYGFIQGDCAYVIYCEDSGFTKEDAERVGEFKVQRAKEFKITEYDDDGEEVETLYGYIVAECEAETEEDYKRVVCEWYGCHEEEAVIEMWKW